MMATLTVTVVFTVPLTRLPAAVLCASRCRSQQQYSSRCSIFSLTPGASSCCSVSHTAGAADRSVRRAPASPHLALPLSALPCPLHPLLQVNRPPALCGSF